MPSLQHIVCLALAASVVKAANDTCPLNWVFIDIHYRAVDSRPDTFSYGLFIGAGANSQNQSLWPAITYNETRLASNEFCRTGSTSTCQDPRFAHGHFGADSSSSWQETPQYVSHDAEEGAMDSDVNLTYGQESLNLFTHYMDPSPATKYVVENHPVTVLSDYTSDQDPFFNSGSLGLGTSSTLLKQLVDIGKIGRKVVGLYLGTAYPRAGGSQNGSMVLGGYDAGRIDGDVHEYPQADILDARASPFKVHVKQMSVVTQDGSSIGLVIDEGFDGYISTSQYALELPQPVLSRLSTALRGSPANDAENVLQLAEPFAGNVTITLGDGYEITYPSEWVSNASNITPFSADTLSSNDTADEARPLVFGTAFLHHLYMTIDYDAATFSLANARMYNNYVQPRSLCPDTLPIALGPPKMNRFIRTGMIGAILGGIIGGVGLFWLMFFCTRKHLQHKQSKEAISKMEGGGVMPAKSSLRTRTKRGLVQFVSAKDKKGAQRDNAKRVSFTDSDSSSLKGVTVTIVEDGNDANQGIEMSNIKHNHIRQPGASQSSPVSPITPHKLSDADTLKDNPQPKSSTQHTTVEPPLPTPDRFTNPYAPSPLQTPLALETPRTGNPLLGNYRGFFNYADDDDSDIESRYQRGHRRTPSDQLRQQLGLTIDTGAKVAKRNSVTEIATPRSMAPRQKPAPLPIKVFSNQRPRPATFVKSEADYVKRNPVRALFGKASDSSGGMSRPSALRKMFPPPSSK